MKSHHYLLLFLSICGAAFFLFPQAPSNPSSTLRVNLGTDPVSLDPRVCMDHPSWCVLKMLYEGLLRTGPERQVLPGIADSFAVSDDGCSYTFHLRESQWSDGSSLSARDFERTWKEILDPAFPAPYAHLMNIISGARHYKRGQIDAGELGIRAVDDRTFVVTLEHPAPWFPGLVTHPLFFPYKQGVFNGPFVVADWIHGAQMQVMKNPQFWDAGQVHLDSIQVSFIGDASTDWMMYCSDELDITGRPFTIGLPEEVLAQGNEDLHIIRDASPYLLLLNTKVPPLANKKCRRALALALDRRAIVEHVLFSADDPATGLLPPALAVTEMNYLQETSEGEAKRLWKEGLLEQGLRHEELAPIILCTNGSQRHIKILACVQEQWRRNLDLDVKLATRDWKVFLDEVKLGDYQIARMGWQADFDDPIALLEIFESADGEANYTGWENAEYQRLLLESRRKQKKQARSAILAQAEAILMDEMPAIPVFHENQVFVTKPGISGLVTECSGGVDFRWARKGANPRPSL